MTCQWYPRTSSQPSRGIVLVVHGLNLNPERMEAVIAILNEIDLDVLLLSLKGHGNNFEIITHKSDRVSRMRAFKTVSYQTWKTEFEAAYREAGSKAKSEQCPVYFMGYSLGGLMGCDFIVSSPRVRFQKMVLIAPAITIHKLSVIYLRLLRLFPRLVIPSLSPEYYRSNKGTPVAAYLAVFKAARKFKENLNQMLNIPTIIFIDQNDEMVSYAKMSQLISKHHLSAWQVHKIERNPDQLKYPYHHLIIDADSAGQEEWKLIKQKIVHHFTSDLPTI